MYPRDTPIILLPKQILRQAPSSVPVPCQPPTALPTCLYSSLKRAFPRSVSSKGAACLPPAGETETWTKSPPASQQAPGLRCSVAPRAQNQVQPQRLPDVAPWGVRESSCLEASHLPSTCSCGRGCACASVCVAECSTCACRCVWREGGERGASHSTALCQAPSAAPFYFALNGLSKDPLSRAAESFLHFKKKKERSEFLLGQ